MCFETMIDTVFVYFKGYFALNTVMRVPFQSANLKDNIDIMFQDGLCTLRIPSVTPSDSGEFVCKATNNAGEKTTVSNISVKGKTLHKFIS